MPKASLRRAKSAEQVLSTFGFASERELLAALTGLEVDKSKRIAACQAASEVRLRVAVPDLISMLNENQSDLSWASAQALWQIGSRRATRPLISVVRTSRDQSTREAATYALGMLGDSRAAPM